MVWVVYDERAGFVFFFFWQDEGAHGGRIGVNGVEASSQEPLERRTHCTSGHWATISITLCVFLLHNWPHLDFLSVRCVGRTAAVLPDVFARFFEPTGVGTFFFNRVSFFFCQVGFFQPGQVQPGSFVFGLPDPLPLARFSPDRLPPDHPPLDC